MPHVEVEKHAPLLNISNKSTFRERHGRVSADHEMVEHFHIDQRERVLL